MRLLPPNPGVLRRTASEPTFVRFVEYDIEAYRKETAKPSYSVAVYTNHLPFATFVDSVRRGVSSSKLREQREQPVDFRWSRANEHVLTEETKFITSDGRYAIYLKHSIREPMRSPSTRYERSFARLEPVYDEVYVALVDFGWQDTKRAETWARLSNSQPLKKASD